MKNNKGLALIYLLLPLTIFTLLVFATPVIEKVKESLPIPKKEEERKMPWEDSVCGNGVCERCESKDECCNYPCTKDPISGSQMCPPPTCLGRCEKDCPTAAEPPNADSCQTDAGCP